MIALVALLTLAEPQPPDGFPILLVEEAQCGAGWPAGALLTAPEYKRFVDGEAEIVRLIAEREAMQQLADGQSKAWTEIAGQNRRLTEELRVERAWNRWRWIGGAAVGVAAIVALGWATGGLR